MKKPKKKLKKIKKKIKATVKKKNCITNITG